MYKRATPGKQRRVSNEKIRKRVLLYDFKLYSGQFTLGKPKKKKYILRFYFLPYKTA